MLCTSGPEISCICSSRAKPLATSLSFLSLHSCAHRHMHMDMGMHMDMDVDMDMDMDMDMHMHMHMRTCTY